MWSRWIISILFAVFVGVLWSKHLLGGWMAIGFFVAYAVISEGIIGLSKPRESEDPGQRALRLARKEARREGRKIAKKYFSQQR